MTEGQKPTSKIVVLISGSGSNLQSIINACEENNIDAQISAVISNKYNVKGLDRAAAANIPSIVIDHHAFDTRQAFDQYLAEVISGFTPDLIILAGFMRILTEEFVNQFVGKLINIHPSLLPAYPGLNTHQRAIEAGDRTVGATVHFVTPELDGGPSILRAQVAVLENDTSDALAARVLTMEHQIYPTVAQWFCEGRIGMKDGIVFFDGVQIDKLGLLFTPQSEH